jgi:hypothetical protein
MTLNAVQLNQRVPDLSARHPRALPSVRQLD